MTCQRIRLVLKARCNIYEYGDSSSKLLAQQLFQASASHLITKIQDAILNMVTDHKAINSVFKQFYFEQYTSQDPCASPEIYKEIQINL